MMLKKSGLAVLGLALVFFAAQAGAVNYNPNTTVLFYIHGFDTEGYQQTGVFGDDMWDDALNQVAAMMGVPTWQTDPTAPNQICASDYYGDTPPAWYTADDIALDASYTEPVPRYAMRMAKYLQHVLNRAPTATGAAVLGGSFGGEISRYLIEHDLLGLASSQKICRWIPTVGVVRGNWAASNAPDWLANLLGIDTPDVSNMTYDWVNSNISNGSTMNTALFGPMVVSQFVATDDTDGYITALCNQPNDSVNLCSDCYFSGYTVSSALHPATDGTLQMPTKSYQSCKHNYIADQPGFWAGAIGAVTNNQRVTITMTRMKSVVSGETFGNGEWVFSSQVTSPQALALYGVTAPVQNLVYSDGESIMLSGMGRGTTKYPNWPIFDMIVPAGETTLNVTFSAYELDWFNKFYDMYEIGSTRTMGTFTVSINCAANNMITVSNGNMQADLTTTVKYVY